MNRINEAFSRARSEHRVCFIPFYEFGYPDISNFYGVIELLSGYGDIIEVGIPFSDPVADGPIIQRASDVAIKNGANLDKAFNWLYEFRKKDSITPVVFMIYYNLIHNRGVREFFSIARDLDLDGVIIPDLPIEESDDVYPYRNGVSVIWLASITTGEERLKKIIEKSDSFIYCVSLKGVTGPRDDISEEGLNLLRRVRTLSSIPTALGFGLKNPEQIRSLVNITDGVIIGSEIIRIVDESNIEELERYLEGLKSATVMV
ncbi:MAG TPA: tryptophan synthase subunit alpha [bacterium]|nr:tryptophan synthase subunit alpha [bacterium]